MHNPDSNQKQSHSGWLRRFFGKEGDTDIVSKEFAGPPEASRKVQIKLAPRGLKVLVVDDDTFFLRRARQTLESQGFEVITVADGSEAIALVRNERIDAMILDVHLQQDVSGVPWNGYNIMALLRQINTTKNLPIIITTIGDPVKGTRESHAAGATSFFHKGSNQSYLATLVNRAVARRRPAAGPKSGEFDTGFRF